MKISCVLVLLPLLCGLVLAQEDINDLFATTASPTAAPPKGVSCPFVDIRSQWLKSAYAEGENICPMRCCTRFSVYGIPAGCLANRDFTVYICCDESDERVKVDGKYVCRSPSSLTVVTQPKFSTPEGFPGDECPKEFLDDYPAAYTEDSFSNEPSELCSGNCFWSTGDVKPPYHYYEYIDCCEGWTKLKLEDGTYTCRCDGRLYQVYGSTQLQCRPATR